MAAASGFRREVLACQASTRAREAVAASAQSVPSAFPVGLVEGSNAEYLVIAPMSTGVATCRNRLPPPGSSARSFADRPPPCS